MRNNRLRLIHDRVNPDIAKPAREEHWFTNARQLSLFESQPTINLTIIAVAEVSAHQFHRALVTETPQIIVDTREYPDFFYVFDSTALALKSFQDLNATYVRTPLNLKKNSIDLWRQFSSFEEKVFKANELVFSVFILSSTRELAKDLRLRIEGFVPEKEKQRSRMNVM